MSLNYKKSQYYGLLGLIALYFIFAMVVPKASDLALALLFVSGLIVYIKNKLTITPDLSTFERGLVIFFLIWGGISILSFMFIDSGRSAQQRLEDDLKFVALIPFYFILRSVKIPTVPIIVVLSIMIFLLGIISYLQKHNTGLSVLSFLELSVNSWRPSGAVNPMRYSAISLIVSISVFLGVILLPLKLFIRFFLVASVLLGLLACLYTQTRGVFISIPFLLLSFVFIFYRNGFKWQSFVALCLGLLLVLGLSRTDYVQNRLFNLTKQSVEKYTAGNSETNLGIRLDMYMVGWGLFLEEPLLGHGLHSFKTITKERKASGELDNVSKFVGIRHTPHNEFLMAAVEKGIIGIILVFGLFAIPFVIFYRAIMYGGTREAKWYGACGATMIIVLFVAGQTGTIFNHNVFTHFYIIWTFLFVSQIRQVAPEVLEWKKLELKPL